MSVSPHVFDCASAGAGSCGWRRPPGRASRGPHRPSRPLRHRWDSGPRPRSSAPPTGPCRATGGRVSRRATRSAITARSALSQMVSARSFSSARVSGFIIAPPPVARTMGGPSSRRRITRASPARNLLLAQGGEDFRHRHPGRLFDLDVPVREGQLQPVGQTSPHRRFAHPHQADQGYGAARPRIRTPPHPAAPAERAVNGTTKAKARAGMIPETSTPSQTLRHPFGARIVR